MSLANLDPYAWGQLCRHVERALEHRPDIGADARQAFQDTRDIVLHSHEPRECAPVVPVCSLCGDAFITSCVRGDRRSNGEAEFSIEEDRNLRNPATPRPGALFCYTCLYRHVDRLDAGLALARRILTSSGGQDHLTALRRVEEGNRFRNVSGQCDLCGRSGPALNGLTGKTYCLACYRAAQAVYTAERNRWEEQGRLRDERFDRELTDYMRRLWAVAREDAQGAFFALEARGETMRPPDESPPPDSPSPSPDNPDSPQGAHVPEEWLPFGSRIARAVSKKLEQAPFVSAAKALWQARPTRVSFGWSMMEQDANAKGRGAGTGAPPGSGGGGAGVPGAPGTPGVPEKVFRDGRPPIPPVITPRDSTAASAIRFLDGEVERALRHRPTRDLMGNSEGVSRAWSALQPKELSPPMLERLLASVSMLRQVLELGIAFYDYTGDELIHQRMSSYDSLGAQLDIGVHEHVKTAMDGGLIVSGGTRKSRARIAGALRRIVSYRTRNDLLGHDPAPFWYVEAEDLYEMSPDRQEEVRRQMLITPPTVMVFGCDDLDRFVEETPKRVSTRIVTYLFMNGQTHLNLDEGRVHVSPPPPSAARPEPP